MLELDLLFFNHTWKVWLATTLCANFGIKFTHSGQSVNCPRWEPAVNCLCFNLHSLTFNLLSEL